MALTQYETPPFGGTVVAASGTVVVGAGVAPGALVVFVAAGVGEPEGVLVPDEVDVGVAPGDVVTLEPELVLVVVVDEPEEPQAERPPVTAIQNVMPINNLRSIEKSFWVWLLGLVTSSAAIGIVAPGIVRRT